VKTQIKAGWYDWFCQDKSLSKKTDDLARKLNRIADSPLINQDTMYVWFKNNCPLVGNLYDDFRIADLETGIPLFVIVPRSGFEKDGGKAQAFRISYDKPWGNPGSVETLVEGSWKDVVTYFKNGGE